MRQRSTLTASSAGRARRSSGWVVDVLIGGAFGALLGAVLAVNIVIFGGISDGYEASLRQVFDESPLIGVLTVIALVSGPVAGVLVARAVRRSRSPGAAPPP